MIRISYPPFVVFFDSLIAILFVMAINQSGGYNVIVPEDSQLDWELVLSTPQGYYLNGSNASFRPTESTFLVPCSGKRECSTSPFTGHDMYMVMPKRIFADISAIVFYATQVGCKSANFYITTTGQLDAKKTLDENPCLREINNISELLR